MANPQRGETVLTVGEKPNEQQFILVFDSNAICELEDALGASLAAITRRWVGSDLAYRDVRAMLWASLRAKHPHVTLKQAGQLMDQVGLAIVAERVMLAFNRAFPEPEKGGDDAGKKDAATGTGAQS